MTYEIKIMKIELTDDVKKMSNFDSFYPLDLYIKGLYDLLISHNILITLQISYQSIAEFRKNAGTLKK